MQSSRDTRNVRHGCGSQPSSFVLLFLCAAALVAVSADLFAASKTPPPPALSLVRETNFDLAFSPALPAEQLPDESHAMARKGGYVYVAGYVGSASAGKNFSVAQFKVGKLDWWSSSSFDDARGGDDEAFDVAIGFKGNVYAIGYMSTAFEGRNIAIEKLDKNLGNTYIVNLNGTANADDAGYGIVCDKDGTIYVTGAWANAGQGLDLWMGKFDPDLNAIGSITFDGPTSGDDKGRCIALDGDGNLFVAGSITREDTGVDVWICKFDSDLNLAEQAFFAGPGAGVDEANGIVVDKTGTVYVTGTTAVEGQGQDIWIGKYDSDLNEIDTTSYGLPDGGDDIAYSIAADKRGHLFLTGKTTQAAGGTNAWLGIFDNDLTFVLDTIYTSANNEYDAASDILMLSSTQMLLTGGTTVDAGGLNTWLSRYKVTHLPLHKTPLLPG